MNYLNFYRQLKKTKRKEANYGKKRKYGLEPWTSSKRFEIPKMYCCVSFIFNICNENKVIKSILALVLSSKKADM